MGVAMTAFANVVCENEHPQVTIHEEINYDEYINNLNDWNLF